MRKLVLMLLAALTLSCCFVVEGATFNELIRAAKKGDVAAQYELGQMFYNGARGVRADRQTALEWFEKAANHGHAQAQVDLANIYFAYYRDGGRNRSQNLKQAIQWYMKAANQGELYAQKQLGFIYIEIDESARDYTQAAYWLELAANQKDAESQTELGHLYEVGGYGLIQDYERAIYWYTQAAMQEYSEAQYSLGRIYATGVIVVQDLNQAIYWYQKAASHGHLNAKNELLVITNSGTTVTTAMAANERPSMSVYEVTPMYENRSVAGDSNSGGSGGIYMDERPALNKRTYGGSGTIMDERPSLNTGTSVTPTPAAQTAQAAQATQTEAAPSLSLTDLTERAKQLLLQDNAVVCGQALEATKTAAQRGDIDSNLKLGDMYLFGKCFKQDSDKAQMYYDRAEAITKIAKGE